MICYSLVQLIAYNYFCCRYKDDKNCSRLIAENLDPDGGISAAQVTNKLKQLGLETRKRLRRGDTDHLDATSFAQPS